MTETTFAVVFTLLCAGLLGLFKLASWSERRHAKVEAEANAVIEAATERHLALAVEDPTPDDEPPSPGVAFVAGAVEVVDELPVRAQGIEVPREGEPEPLRPCTPCVNHWADGKPGLAHTRCLVAIEEARHRTAVAS